MQTQLYNPGAEDSAVQTFDFNGLALRALLIDGEPRFVLVDACKALELSNARMVANSLDEDDVSSAYVTDSLGRSQQTNIITESGLYQVIFQSRKAEAKAFKRWVTDEVLPAIRRTGAYEAPKTLEERSLALLGELTAVVAEQKAELEVARPKVATYDKVLTPEHTFGFRDLTKAVRDKYPVNEADIKRLLTQKGVIIPGRRLDVYSAAIDKGYAVRRASGKWGGKERFQARFTTKTLEWLLAELAPLEEVA